MKTFQALSPVIYEWMIKIYGRGCFEFICFSFKAIRKRCVFSNLFGTMTFCHKAYSIIHKLVWETSSILHWAKRDSRDPGVDIWSKSILKNETLKVKSKISATSARVKINCLICRSKIETQTEIGWVIDSILNRLRFIEGVFWLRFEFRSLLEMSETVFSTRGPIHCLPSLMSFSYFPKRFSSTMRRLT